MKIAKYLPLLLLFTTQEAFSAKKSDDLFQELKITSPTSLTHPVHIADVLPDAGKELVTLGVDKDNEYWLIIYKQAQDSVEIAAQLKLDKSISRFDISEDDAKQQKIYFQTHDSLMAFEPATTDSSAKLKTITAINSIFLDPKPPFIAKDDFVYQLDDKGQDFIVITQFDGLAIFDSNGNRMNQESINIKPQVKMGDDFAEFIKPKIYIADANFDGLLDIIQAGEGELISYVQTPANTTQSQIAFARSSINVNEAISGIDWWDKRDASGDSLDQTNLIYRTLEDMTDVNGDGISDLVVKYTQSSGVLDRANDFEVFFGRNQNNQLAYSDKADTVIKGEGTLTGLRLVDINNDNVKEVMLSGFDIGVSQIISALMSGSVDQDVYLYKLDPNNKFGEDADVEKEVELSFSISSGQSGNPIIELVDINNDGLKDLILSSSEKTLKVYYGQNGKRLFSKRSKRYRTSLPKNGFSVQTGDINGDDKEDIVFKYGRLDSDEKKKEFRVLLSK